MAADGFEDVTVDEDLSAEDFPDLDTMSVEELQAHYTTLCDYQYDSRLPTDDVEDIIHTRSLETWDRLRAQFPKTAEPECSECGERKWGQTPGNPPRCRGCGNHPPDIETEETMQSAWNTYLHGEPAAEVATDGGQDPIPSEAEVVDEHGADSVETYSGGFVSAPPAYEAAHQPEPMPDPESACIECGDEAHNHRCGDCGMPICGMHNELGAGFCSDCPTEDYEPAARTDGGTVMEAKAENNDWTATSTFSSNLVAVEIHTRGNEAIGERGHLIVSEAIEEVLNENDRFETGELANQNSRMKPIFAAGSTTSQVDIRDNGVLGRNAKLLVQRIEEALIQPSDGDKVSVGRAEITLNADWTRADGPQVATDGGTTVDETDDPSGELPKTVDSWRDTHEDWLGVGAAIARDDVEAFQTHADALRDELDAMEATLQNRGAE